MSRREAIRNRRADALTRRKHPVNHAKVAQILHRRGYSLQGSRKTEEGEEHPDRDAQFRHINNAVKQYLKRGYRTQAPLPWLSFRGWWRQEGKRLYPRPKGS